MKLLAKPIDMIALFLNREKPKPVRFRFQDEDGSIRVVRIEKIFSVCERSVPGVKTYVYECQSTEGMESYRFELMYKPDSDSWLLYKM